MQTGYGVKLWGFATLSRKLMACHSSGAAKACFDESDVPDAPICLCARTEEACMCTGGQQLHIRQRWEGPQC